MTTPDQVSIQYKDPSNLEARISLHQRFSTNLYPWMRWVFDHFKFSVFCRILEVGCGPGYLWAENNDRIEPGWHIMLSDASLGMLGKTRQTLKHIEGDFNFKVINVEYLPIPDASYDAVIANHMLYYPDPGRALPEIHRVLKPGGKLYASTNGLRHLSEIDDLIAKSTKGERSVAPIIQAFNLENGHAILEEHFDQITLDRQENNLLVTDAKALVAFCLSVTLQGKRLRTRRTELIQFISKKMNEAGGSMLITKDAGMFVASKKE